MVEEMKQKHAAIHHLLQTFRIHYKIINDYFIVFLKLDHEYFIISINEDTIV